MKISELVSGLKSVDDFHKNLMALFNDLVSSIKEKTYTDTLQHLTGPETPFWSNATESEHMGRWVFKHNDCFRFITTLIKINDAYLRDGHIVYKTLCSQLERDPKFPLLFSYGKFEPRNMDNFLSSSHDCRRNWMFNTIFINILPEHKYQEISSIRFGEMMTLESPEGSNPWYCEKAKFVISDLVNITDSAKLSELADKLLKI